MEEQVEFWRTDVKNHAELEQLVVKTIVKKRVESRSASSNGQYLPLSVYEKMGYDTAVIRAKCKDTKMHATLGLTYKIDIESTEDKTLEAQVKSELYQKKLKPEKKLISGNDDVSSSDKSSSRSVLRNRSSKRFDQPRSKRRDRSRSRRRDRSRSRRRDRSRSKRRRDHSRKRDRSSSNKRRRERSERADGGRKRVDKETLKEQKKELEAVKTARTCKTHCRKALAKIASAKFALDSHLADEMLSHVPKFAQEKAQKALKTLKKIEDEAKTKVLEDAPQPVSWSPESLSEMCKSAEEAATLVDTLLATARKNTLH